MWIQQGFIYINIFRRMSRIAPGIPKIPTRIEVPTFNPMWNEKAPPIKFITKMRSPPKTEFTINLKIALRGIENSFPTIHKPMMQPIIIITVEKSKFYHHTF